MAFHASMLKCSFLDNHLKGTSQSQKRMRFVMGVKAINNHLTKGGAQWNYTPD